MTAGEARQLVEEANGAKSGRVKALVAIAEQAIEEAARKGLSMVPNPLVRSLESDEVIRGAYWALGELGFSVNLKSDDVEGRSWSTISW